MSSASAKTISAPESDAKYAAFEVQPWVHHAGRHVARHPAFWVRLGNLESRLRSEDIEDIEIEKPVFVCGLARAGTTILLEVLSSHPDLGSHRYRDDPFLFTPIFWNRFLERLPEKRSGAAERAHGDGIEVTSESPEAFEEVLWMAFFDCLHDPQQSSVLDGSARHPAFEKFYLDHLRKVLWVRGRGRYLSKTNYNLTRLEYLLKLFPDARFVVPVRAPAAHIASLMKQHKLFSEGESRHPRALEHMRRIGHFEFGLDRRPINVADGTMPAILRAFDSGLEVRGWALYWASLHNWLADRLEADEVLRQAVQVVRFEDLCRESEPTLRRLFDHCRLPDSAGLVAAAAERMRMPSYYRPDFSEDELATIAELTDGAARRLGYEAARAG